MPGVSSGTRNIVRPLCLVALGSLRVSRKTYCARSAPLVRERAREEFARFGAESLGLRAEAPVERAGAGIGEGNGLRAVVPEPRGRAQQLVTRVAARERPRLRAAVVELDIVLEREAVAAVRVQRARRCS